MINRVITLKQDRARWTGMLAALLMLILCCVLLPNKVQAHASLLQASPHANEQRSDSPGQVELVFSEPVEREGYSLRVLNLDKQSMANQEAALSSDRRSLTLALPQLPTGTYLVSYHIISSDGHPVEGTYLFSVGEMVDENAAKQAFMGDFTLGEGPGSSLQLTDVLVFAIRALYYLWLVVFTGWIVWMRITAKRTGEGLRLAMQAIAVKLQQGYVILFLLLVWAHLPGLMGESGAEALLRFLINTPSGMAWLASTALALLSMFVLHKRLGLDLLWVALVWAVKAGMGHAAAQEPAWAALGMDVLHLGAASIWAGGLAMLLYLWRKDLEEAKRYYVLFSKAALLCAVLLLLSGAALAVLYLGDIRYVVLTVWGKLLLVKTVLMAAVLATAAGIRRLVPLGKERAAGRLLRLDAAWMVCIALIAGIFTYLTPAPVNEPLYWHEMDSGQGRHLTVEMTPKAPGMNDIKVKVWLPETLGEPKHVILKITDLEDEQLAPLEVPLTAIEDQSFEESWGMKKYTYTSRGSYLPYPGRWLLEVRVMDREDNETVDRQEITVY